MSTVLVRIAPHWFAACWNTFRRCWPSVVLGSAGAVSVARDFANAPRTGHSYSIALANSLAGTDINGTGTGFEEINSQFNTDIDNGTCLTGTTGWSYTVNNITDPPAAGTIPLLPVVFHELGHGLGFQTFASGATGALFNGFPDQWTQYLFDVSTNKNWSTMTNAERSASAINDPSLVWTGPNVTVDKTGFLGTAPKFVVTAPAAIAGAYDAQQASFGSIPPSPAGVSGDVVRVDDGTGTLDDGCEAPFVNAAALVGKVALIQRGTCAFTVKVKNAQLAGATAAIIYNNAASGLPGMGGADATVTIPSYGVTQALGNSIIAQLAVPAVVTGTLGYDPSGALSGTNRGFVRMFAPNPLQQGSSVSHFHSDATPNLLMEPSLNTSIFSNVDMTLSLFRDIGWRDVGTRYNYIFNGTFEDLP
jgi:hypothetical protein